MRIARMACSALMWCLLAFGASSAFATDFTVNTLADTTAVCGAGGACSLREAIAAANASAGADRVILGTGQVYQLSLGALGVTDALTIDGHGSTIDGQGFSRVLDIQGGLAVTINNLTITGGIASGFLSFGGGLNIAGGGAAVIMNNSTVSGNTGLNGGGILCVLCALTVTNSTISGNTASGANGGGIDLTGDASTLTVSSSTLTTNNVTGLGAQGGGVSVPFGTSVSTLSRSRIVSNTANTASGDSDNVDSDQHTNKGRTRNDGP